MVPRLWHFPHCGVVEKQRRGCAGKKTNVSVCSQTKDAFKINNAIVSPKAGARGGHVSVHTPRLPENNALEPFVVKDIIVTSMRVCTWIDSRVAARLWKVFTTSGSTSGAHARSHTTRGQHMQRIRGQAPSKPASTIPCAMRIDGTTCTRKDCSSEA